jgi:hypothetical protein
MAERVNRERELLELAMCVIDYRYVALHKKIRELLDQPEQDKKSKVDFQTLNEMGLKRLQVSDDLVLQESCAKSPTLIFAENGNVIEIIKYKKLLEIRNFIDEILNYSDTPQIGGEDE